MEITLDYGLKYKGAIGNKPWIALITGSDNHYGMKRTFIEPDKTERDTFSSERSMIHFHYDLEEGLYEMCEAGERWFAAALPQKDGSLKLGRISDARIKAWIAALDEDSTQSEARLTSKGL